LDLGTSLELGAGDLELPGGVIPLKTAKNLILVPTVFIPAQMRYLTRGLAQVVTDGDTVAAVVDALECRFPGIRERLCKGDSLAPGLQVAVDATVTTRGLRSKLKSTSEVHFLPAFGGG
jgi:molybdopterin synthase sulfur carrier subunit